MRIKIADQYILRTMLGPIIFGVGIFACLFLIMNITNQMSDMLTKHMSFLLIVQLMVYMFPSTLIFSIPMGVLMGTMIAFGNLSSHSEILSYEAAGVSSRRLTLSAIFMALMLSLMMLGILQYVVPQTRTKIENVLKEMIFAKPTMLITPGSFIQDIPGFSLYVNELDKESGMAQNVVYFQDMGGTFPVVTIAKSMKIQENQVILSQGEIVNLDNNGKSNVVGNFDTQLIPMNTLSGNLDEGTFDATQYFSLTELMHLIKSEKATGKDSIPTQIMLQQYLAMSFSPIILIFLGTLLSIKNHRSGKGVGFGFSVLLIFIYVAMTQVGVALAVNHALTPFLAMWYPNFLLIGFSLILFIKQKKVR